MPGIKPKAVRENTLSTYYTKMLIETLYCKNQTETSAFKNNRGISAKGMTARMLTYSNTMLFKIILKRFKVIWENAFLLCETHTCTYAHTCTERGPQLCWEIKKRLAGDTQNVKMFPSE